MTASSVYDNGSLPPGIRSRFVSGVNGLNMHVLEAGGRSEDRPTILLLHGFPELAYSWRKVLPTLAAAGFHVIAPDQRGYGQTTGWDSDYGGDLQSFRLSNLVDDILALLAALDIGHVASVIGHDFGASVAAYAALIHPKVFQSMVLMSAPFAGPPTGALPSTINIHQDLAALIPPRKHYQHYYSTRSANDDMHHCRQGVGDFLRAYFHHKSADWAANLPVALSSWTAAELAKLPTYYIMNLNETMAETVAKEMPSTREIADCAWLTDTELAVYIREYARTGFQGGLQWYRCRTEGINQDLEAYSGHTINVPAAFIAGAQDWGVHQTPNAFDTMKSTACTDMRMCHLINGAGHWVQQEQAEEVSKALLTFLRSLN